ncbi:MAG: cytochrome b/b6 domain-containing protein, partial [Deltaproteobacteria bacterium]|nr:cytochrome b/b6 domain-containing protein [Deltaproteobacteria bacterium]
MDGANDDRELAPDIGSPLPTRHSSLFIALHWATAVLALLLVSTGLTMSRLPGADPQRLWYTRFHLFAGLIMGAVVLTRLFSLISR